MVRYTIILILAILLAASSYIIYENKFVVINIETGSRGFDAEIVKSEKTFNQAPEDGAVSRTTPKATIKPDISDQIEEFEDDSDIEVHLDPTLGVDINSDQHIASSYRVIGPRQFVLLTDKDEPMVEIDLQTGKVTIGSEYDLDQVSTEFWNSIGNKYPEVCFVEKN